MSSSAHARPLVRVLVQNYINQEKCPHESADAAEQHGLFYGLTTAVASLSIVLYIMFLRLPYSL